MTRPYNPTPDDGWLNGGLPFIDHVFPNGKTGRQNAREALRKWAAGLEVERALDRVIKQWLRPSD